MYKTTHCKICSKEYRNCNFAKHNCLKDQPKFKILEEWKSVDGLYKCPDCELEFSKMGLVGHYYRKHDIRGIDFLEVRKNNSKKHNKKRLTKEEISAIYSASMKKAYKNGNAKGWDHINLNKNRRSYPEKFFLRVFEENKIFKKYEIKEKYPYSKYVIDFLIVDLKLVIEIDGSQHYRTPEAIEHDRIRDDFFISEGFKVYRIKWYDVYKNAKDEILQLINFIENINNETIRKYTIEEIKKEIRNKICKCGNEIKTKKCNKCNTCRCFNNRKIINRPSLEQILIDVKEFGYSGTGRKYNVSDNAIRKWIKNTLVS